MTQAYKLLTPGPLTTTDSVKREMLVDRCTWDDDYKAVTQKIRRRLLELAQVSEQEYTAVLMQGSGTFGVESVLSSVVGAQDKLLICSNGAYGERQVQICEWNRIPYAHYAEAYDKVPDARKIADILARDPSITHVAMVHSETTTGILNDIQAVGAVVKAAGRTFIVDAMSSFGGVEIPVADWGVDFLISSANKCIQGVPGFSFILCRRAALLASEGKARSLSLNLLDQWRGMERDGKWRYTSPTHVVLAFSKALDRAHAAARLCHLHRAGAPVADHHDVLLSGGCFVPFSGILPVHQGARLCDLSRQADRAGYVPYWHHRRGLRGGYRKAGRDYL